jgi:hypothetical protein
MLNTRALKSACENWVVPLGLDLILDAYPALKRWANLDRPSGAGFSEGAALFSTLPLIPAQYRLCR